jgi:polyphosphate glucokinase
MNILSIDVGGKHVKALVSGQSEPRRMESGPRLTAPAMVRGIKDITCDWTYDVVSLGYAGQVVHGIPVHEPVSLGQGWTAFDYAAGFGCPVRIVNDAAMQAIGSYEGGRMLFLGLGSSLGAAFIVDGQVAPMELGHLPYKRGRSYVDFVGHNGLVRYGKKKWRQEVAAITEVFRAALQPDYVVLGGGNAKLINDLPSAVRRGDNTHAFLGGFRLWQEQRWITFSC